MSFECFRFQVSGFRLRVVAVPRRARIEGSKTFLSLNSRLESNKEEEEGRGLPFGRGGPRPGSPSPDSPGLGFGVCFDLVSLFGFDLFGFGAWILGFGVWILGFGVWILGFWVLSFRFRV